MNKDEKLIYLKNTTQKSWEEFRQVLADKKFNYKEVDKAKEITFLKQLDDMFTYSNNQKNIPTKLQYIAKSSNLCRATKLSEEEKKDKNKITYSRFKPDQKNHPSINRFSPVGIDYLYLAIRFGKFKSTKSLFNCLEQTCLNEIRAEKGQTIAFCKFKINKDSDYKKVIDLTIADNKTYDDLLGGMLRSCAWRNADKEKIVNDFCRRIYFKLISEELFIPVKTEDPNIEYAPFHCLAYYFTSLGYDGIIYKSTVYDKGKNIVLFNKDDADGVDKIRIEEY